MLLVGGLGMLALQVLLVVGAYNDAGSSELR